MTYKNPSLLQRTLVVGMVLSLTVLGATLAGNNNGLKPPAPPKPATPAKPAGAAIEEPVDKDVVMISGHVVDAFTYVTANGMADSDQAQKGLPKPQPALEALATPLAPDPPIALVEDPEAMSNQGGTGKRVYLIVFDIQNDKHRRAYTEARRLVGKEVHLTGKIFQRDGLEALNLISITESEIIATGAPNKDAGAAKKSGK